MIIARIEDSDRYYALHPLLKPLFEYVKSHDLLTAPAGRITLQGDDLFINVNVIPIYYNNSSYNI